MVKNALVLYVNMGGNVLLFLELCQILILCTRQVPDVPIVEIHLYFVSLSFYFTYRPGLLSSCLCCIAAWREPAPPRHPLCVHTACADQAEEDGFPSVAFPDNF